MPDSAKKITPEIVWELMEKVAKSQRRDKSPTEGDRPSFQRDVQGGWISKGRRQTVT